MQIIVVEDLPLVRLGLEASLAPLGRPILGLPAKRFYELQMDQPSFIVIGPFVPFPHLVPFLHGFLRRFPSSRIVALGPPLVPPTLPIAILPRSVSPHGLLQYVQTNLGDQKTVSLASLSRREQEVLALLARGLRNRDIAAGLGTSEKTVRNHLVSVFQKLGIKSRSEAIVWAQAHQLISTREA